MKRLLTLLILLQLFIFVGCSKPEVEDEVIIDHQVKTLMENTIYATEAHIFTTNIPGPKVAIVGGIHGDEVAGWKAGLELLNTKWKKGTYLLIPRANILATQLELRYPGIKNNGIYNDIKYSDLNRSFPGKINGTITEQIAYAIANEVGEFNPDYIIDLHESRESYTSGYLGNSLIYTNLKTSLFAVEIVEEMNNSYLKETDTPFHAENSAPIGSFNNYFSNNFDAYVITFETNRVLDLFTRIDQQIALIQILINKI